MKKKKLGEEIEHFYISTDKYFNIKIGIKDFNTKVRYLSDWFGDRRSFRETEVMNEH